MVRIVSAPMATLSHEAFRRMVERFGGCDEYFTEMINAASLLNNGPWEKFYIQNQTAPQKIVWQLTGNDGEKIAQAARLLCAKGGIGVDINMGCSAPQIYKTGAGISWMTKPLSQTAALVKGVHDELYKNECLTGTHLRLSVKCRLGDEDFTEESFFSFCQMLCENGVEVISVHPRTKKEKCRTFPRFEIIQKACEKFSEADFYINGCIKDAQSAKLALKKCPSAKGIMTAREAAQKPWVFRYLHDALFAEQNGTEYTPCHTADRLSVLLNFIDDVILFQPKEFVKTRLQRFFSYYCLQFFFGHSFATNMINRAGNPDECKDYAVKYFERNPQEQFITF